MEHVPYEDICAQVEIDLAASARLPGQTTEDARVLLRDAYHGGLATGFIRPTNTFTP